MQDAWEKVLFISYIFPPVGGSGVQRNLKYVKYLPASNWQPLVITVKDIMYHVHDYSLVDEIPNEAIIVRTGSIDPFRIGGIIKQHKNKKQEKDTGPQSAIDEFHPPSHLMKAYRTARSFLAFPDSVVGWMPFVIIAGIKIFRQHRFQVIFARSVPYTGAIAALILSKLTYRPYVLDFADGWTDDPHLNAPSLMHKKGHAWLERMIVGRANHVIVYSDVLARRFELRYPWLSNRITILPNGYDPEDFSSVMPMPRDNPNKHRIVYIGSLYEHQIDNFLTFLGALRNLSQQDQEIVEVFFIGKVHFDANRLIMQYGLSSMIKLLGYKPHFEALSYLASADSALLFIKEGDKTMVTGKIFEYLGMQVPVIAIIEPDGLAADILRKVDMGMMIVPPRDVERLSKVIRKSICNSEENIKPTIPQIFNRERLTKQLAVILDKISNASMLAGDNQQSW